MLEMPPGDCGESSSRWWWLLKMLIDGLGEDDSSSILICDKKLKDVLCVGLIPFSLERFSIFYNRSL